MKLLLAVVTTVLATLALARADRGTSPAAATRPAADAAYMNGILVSPRTAAAIEAELGRIRAMKVETVPGRGGPAVAAARDGGNDSQADREAAVRRLIEYRYLCFVPHEGIVLDAQYNAHAEAACGILKEIGRLDHDPPNPGWPADRYALARRGAGASNIYTDNDPAPGLGVRSIDAYMNDSDPRNITRVGHRRWCLSPRLGRTGIAAWRGYAALWVRDDSRRDVPDFDYVAYPAPGPFPVSHFGRRAAFSVQVNEARYQKPDARRVRATITPVRVLREQGQVKPLGGPLKLDFFAIDNSVIGSVQNAVIFRAADLRAEHGAAYLVEVTGLTPRGDAPATIRYVTEFFAPKIRPISAE